MEENESPEAEKEFTIEFRKDLTAREWLAQQKGRTRTMIMGQLSGIFVALTEESKNSLNVRNGEDLLNLNFKDFISVINAYGNAYGEDDMLSSFLG